MMKNFFRDYGFWLRISKRGNKFFHLRSILAVGHHYLKRKVPPQAGGILVHNVVL
jgi:hypothetical protein